MPESGSGEGAPPTRAPEAKVTPSAESSPIGQPARSKLSAVSMRPLTYAAEGHPDVPDLVESLRTPGSEESQPSATETSSAVNLHPKEGAQSNWATSIKPLVERAGGGQGFSLEGGVVASQEQIDGLLTDLREKGIIPAKEPEPYLPKQVTDVIAALPPDRQSYALSQAYALETWRRMMQIYQAEADSSPQGDTPPQT